MHLLTYFLFKTTFPKNIFPIDSDRFSIKFYCDVGR